MSEKEKEAIVEEQQQDISELLQIRRDKLSCLLYTSDAADDV